MRPRFPLPNKTNESGTHSVFARKASLSPWIGSNGLYVRFGELGSPVFLATEAYIPSSRDHVLNIVSLCSNKKVIRINTSRGVALMSNHCAIWCSHAISHFPRQHMGETRLPIPSHSSVGKRLTDYSTAPKNAVRLIIWRGVKSQPLSESHSVTDSNASVLSHPDCLAHKDGVRNSFPGPTI